MRSGQMDLKSLLNKEQYEAATTIQGQLLILAGAGSGKTRVLTYRIAHMIEDLGIYPSQILAITFTNKAAGEMKERVRHLVGDEADNMWISTFHSSCVRVLRREIDKIGYKKDFTIYDSYDSKTLVRQCMKELQINDKEITESEVISKIGKAKDNLIYPDAYKREHQYDYRENKIADLYVLYQKRLKNNNAVDFDDIIFKTVELFKAAPEVLEFYQRKFKYIMIDEYQDTNRAQYEFVKLLASAHKNICVVGDDDQCVPEGTMIKVPQGEVAVEAVKEGLNVVSASGNGEVTTGTVEKVWKRKYTGPMVKITTESGRSFRATPNHITFARVNIVPGSHYVYLMYKKDFGYRIGQTQAVRSRRGGDLANGLAVRLNQEQGDKMWILKNCSSKGEAAYYEHYYSVKYGIPTMVFKSKGRHLSMGQEDIDRLFKEINTYEAADRVMEDSFLCSGYPHHFSSAVTRGSTNRKIVNLSFFSCKKSVESGYYSHRISFITSGEEYREKFKKEGFSTRAEKGKTWRVETERRQYDDAEVFAKQLSVIDDLDIMRKAKLTSDKSFYFLPVGSLIPGMSVASYSNGAIIEDKVLEVSLEQYDGYVYDLSIPELRQYICGDVVLHNCIYAWRGADIKNILDFEKDYPQAKVVKLEQNYRSTSNILDAANSVIKNNSERKSKVLRTDSEAGEKIRIYRAYSDLDEGEFAAAQIKKYIDEEEKNFRDFAILYRTNAQSRVFEEIFIRRNIPYRIIGGLKFYDRKEIKDIMAYLKIINNPSDDISLQRIVNVPKRSIGDATVAKVLEFADSAGESFYDALLDIDDVPGLGTRTLTAINKFTAIMEKFMVYKETMTVSQLINAVLEDTGYLSELKASPNIEDESRIENLKELVSAAVEFERTSEDKTLSAFLEQTTLVSDIDNFDENADTVVLMTVHSAKGLEFPVVFMVGMENGIFPGNASFNSESEMEESRRLCYVGITRARERLFLTYADRRTIFGRTVSYSRSDFIEEIATTLVEDINISRPAPRTNTGQNSAAAAAYSRQNNNPHSLRNMPSSHNDVSYNDAQRKISEILGDGKSKALTENEATLGRKVKHSKFGVGTIVRVTKDGSDVKLTIAFDNMGVKNLILNLAQLELI
jgi:DNA helicase II / ATP-dependent DNA helicase PcrA